MSIVNTINSPAYSQSAQSMTPFERNSRVFGPAAASAIGLADAATEAAGTTVSISSKAMSELAESGKDVASSIGDAATSMYKAFGHAVDGIEAGVKEFGQGIADMTHDGLEEVRDATHTVLEGARDAAHTVAEGARDATHAVLQGGRDAANYAEMKASAVASSVSDAAGSVASSISNAASNVSGYATLGVAAADHMINAVV